MRRSDGEERGAVKLSFSTNAFVRHSVFDAVEAIAALGYDGVELLADVPHLYADGVRGNDLDRLRHLLDRTGLAVANINANTAVGYYGKTFWEPVFEPSLAHPEPSERRWRVDYTRRCIDMAARLGCGSVSVTSGRMIPGIFPEASLDLLQESLGELLDYAGERDIRLGIEYEPGLLIECCEDLAAFLARMNHPSLGANLDLGHSHVLGEAPEEVLTTLGGRVFHLHLEDIRGRKHYHLIPGTGEMDFGELARLLKARGYEGFVTVELYTYPHQPKEAARQSLEYLRPLFDL